MPTATSVATTDATMLAKEPFISVTTYKRDGTPVATPVWCAGDNGTLLVHTEADAGKVKRIRHDSHVTVAPCNFRGKPRGPAIEGDAAIINNSEEVDALLTRKYPWTWRGYNLLMAIVWRLHRQAPPQTVTIRIALR